MQKSTIIEKYEWRLNIFGLATLITTTFFLLEANGNINAVILILAAALFQFVLRLPPTSLGIDDISFGDNWMDFLTYPNVVKFSENKKINKYWLLSYKIVVYIVLNIVLAYTVWNPITPHFSYPTFVAVFKGLLLFLLGYLILGLFAFFRYTVIESIIKD